MSLQMLTRQAELFKALSHPRRLEIIQLIRDNELPVQDIHEMLDLPQANVSQHLSLLKKNKIVVIRKEGKQRFYKLSHKKIILANDLIKEFILSNTTNTEPKNSHDDTDHAPTSTTTHADPVCGMVLTPQTASFTYTHLHTTYYFCASGCLESFKKNHDKK